MKWPFVRKAEPLPLPNWCSSLVDDERHRRFFLISNGALENAQEISELINNDDVVVQFNMCRHSAVLKGHRGLDVRFLHVRALNGEIIGRRVLEAQLAKKKQKPHCVACFDGRSIRQSKIENSSKLELDFLDYSKLTKAAGIKFPRHLIPSIGFTGVSWLRYVNQQRQLAGLESHEIVLCGFSGQYQHGVFVRHDFALEQRFYQTMDDVYCAGSDGQIEPFLAKEPSSGFNLRNVIPKDFNFFRATKSDLFAILSKISFHEKDFESATAMARLAAWAKPTDVASALRLLVDMEISNDEQQAYFEKKISVITPGKKDINKLTTLTEARDFLKPLDLTEQMSRFAHKFGSDGAYSRPDGSEKRALLLNHTAWIPGNSQHLGCFLVSQQLEKQLTDRGIKVVGWVNSLEGLSQVTRLDPDLCFDTVVFNGEGTLHHARPRAFELLTIGKLLAQRGKSVHLVNSIWEDNPTFFAELLEGYSSVSVRDRASLQRLEADGVRAHYAPDLSWAHTISTQKSEAAIAPIGVQDCVLKENARTLAGLARKLETPFHVMGRFYYEVQQELIDGTNPLRFPKILQLDDFGATESWVTGRYHGLILALRHRQKAVSVASNTSKILELLNEIGIPDAHIPNDFCTDSKGFHSAANRLLENYPTSWEAKVDAFEDMAVKRISETFDRIAQ